MVIQMNNTHQESRPGWFQKCKSALADLITYGAILLIALLAIPACLFGGLISLVWNTADHLDRLLKK